MNKVVKHVQEAKDELDKVIFPTKTEIKQSYLSVFIVVSVVTLFLSLIDVIMSSSLEAIL